MAVDLASGVEQNTPGPDLWAYNPLGPAVSYERLYRSKTASLGYASPGLSPGWTDNFDLYVIPGSGNFTLYYNNGSNELWTGTSGTLTTPNGSPYLAKVVSSTVLSMTFKDRSVYQFTKYTTASANGNYPAGTYLLTKITNLVGHSVSINRDTAANNYRLTSLQNDAATPVTLLSFSYDGNGHLQTLQDLASPNASEHRQVSYTFGLASDPNLTQPILTAVSQVGSANALWKYDYQALGGMPFLTSVSAPDPSDPTGMAYTSALASYDAAGHVQAHLDVAQGNVPDPNGKQHTYGYRAGATDVTLLNSSLSTSCKFTANLNANNTSAGFTDASSHTETVSYFGASTPEGAFLPHIVTNRNMQQVDIEYDTANTYANIQSMTDPRGTSVNYTYFYPNDFALGELQQVQEMNVTGSTTTAKQATTMDYYGTSNGVFNGLLMDVFSPQPGQVNGTAMVKTYFVYTGTSTSSLGNLMSVTTVPTTGGVMINNSATSRTVTYAYTSVTDSVIGYSYTAPQGEAVSEPIAVTVTGAGNPGYDGEFTFQYDGRGNTTATIDGVGNRTDYTYNAADQMTEMLYPPTNPATPTVRAYVIYTYEYLGGPVSSIALWDETNTKIRETDYTYGKGGETASVSDLKGLLSAYTYDGCYRVSTLQDGNQNTTSYSYDTVGRLYQVKYPNPNSQASPYDILTYTYDNDDNLTKRVDGNNVETDYNLDPIDSRPQSMTYPAAANSNVYYGYDALERMSSIAIGPSGSAQVTKTYTFDDLDAMLNQTVSFAGGPQGQQFVYSYYADGSRQQLQTPQGNYGYQYDGIGRLTLATFPWAGGFVSHSYERNGWLRRTAGPRTRTDYTYNGRGFLTGLNNSSVQDHELVSNFFDMTYDGAGNRTGYRSEIPSLGNDWEASRSQFYHYDSRDELIEDGSTYLGTNGNAFVGDYDLTFGYDLAQNPTTFRSGTAAYNKDNQFTSSSFAYDGNGNPTKYESSTSGNAVFDPENRLLSISNPAFGTLSALYDGDGLRARKSVGGATTYYLYDGDTPLLEENASGTVTAANGPAADGWRARYYPGSLKFGGSTEYGMQAYEYLYDPQGNLVQRQSQNNEFADVLDTVLYDAYGNPSNDLDTSTGAAEVYKDPVGFGGQYGYYRDVETGLSLLTNRYYDAGVGRFINRDPIGYQGGINLYGFCGNNPVNYSDPSGYGYTPFDEALDIGSVFFDTGKLVYDHYHGASDAEVGVDRTALALDGLGLVPIVPPGMGRAYALAHGGIEAVHAIQALRHAQTAAKLAQGVSFATGSGNSGGTSSTAGSGNSGGTSSAAGSGRNAGRNGKQTRLRQLLVDPKASAADRGWIQQEVNAIRQGKRTRIRVPIGKVLAHRRGMRARNGNSYLQSDLQDVDLHRLEHKHEGYR